MGEFIVKLREHYLVWSTIVDAPISEGMSLDELKEWIRDEHGKRGMETLPGRLARVEAKGTSSLCDDSAESAIWLNRAGPKEKPMTILGIYRHYCLGEPIRKKWLIPKKVVDLEEDNGEHHAAALVGWDAAKRTGGDAAAVE